MMRLGVRLFEHATFAKSMFATGMWQRNQDVCIRDFARRVGVTPLLRASASPMPGEDRVSRTRRTPLQDVVAGR
jgi:hypothetical protein